MSISLAIASFDQDVYLQRTIDSVYDWVDEIILVYCSPQDELIKSVMKHDPSHKIRLTYFENHPMFHINKQKAIDLCTKEWIVQLDADEVVSPALKKEIVAVISSADAEPVAYWMPRLNYFLGRPLRKGGQYPDKTIRLYRNGVAHLPCKSLHEQVTVKGTVGELSGNLLHYPYPDFYTYLRKWMKYGAGEIDPTEVVGLHLGLWGMIKYGIIKPKLWFLKAYFRHRGYVDGFPGFVFALFSALRYWLIYISLWEKKHEK